MVNEPSVFEPLKFYYISSLSLIFRKLLGSSETPEAEPTESNDVVKPVNREEAEINDNLKPVTSDKAGASSKTRHPGQRGGSVYRQALTWLQKGPSHATCRHKHSCMYYVLEVSFFELLFDPSCH